LLVQDELEKFAGNVSHSYLILIYLKSKNIAELFQIQMTANTFRYGFAPVLTQRFAQALAGYFNEYFHPYTPLTGDEILVGNTATALNGTRLLLDDMPNH
jgi:hypothetical protein